MDFFIDANTGQLLSSTTFPTPATDVPEGKLQSDQTIRVQYSNPDPAGGTANLPCAAPNSYIQFGLKREGHYDDTAFDVSTDTFAAPADPTQASAFYTATLTIDSTALRALFPVATDGTAPDFVMLMGEIRSGTLPSQTFDFKATNCVIKGTESPAISTPGATYPPPVVVAALAGQGAFIFFCGDPGAGDFSITGATAYTFTASVVGGATGYLVVIPGASAMTQFQCTSADIVSLGTLPAGLTSLDVTSNFLPSAQQDSILAQLVTNGLLSGTLDISAQGGPVPSAAGLASVATLHSRGWTVYHS